MRTCRARRLGGNFGGMTSHADARAYANQALTETFGGATTGETSGLAGVSFLETGYGDGWKGAGKGSNNMGAEQCGPSWTGLRFSYVDKHPNADGTSTPYRVDFRKFLRPIDGWRDLVDAVYRNRGRSIVRQAAQASDFFGLSRGLYRTGYYEGFGANADARIAFHYRALSRAIAAADKAIAPHVAVHEIPPTLRRGARDVVRHGAVWILQTELQVAADGAFGPHTLEALNGYKRAAGLPVDGVCDRATWEALFSDDFAPVAA